MRYDGEEEDGFPASKFLGLVICDKLFKFTKVSEVAVQVSLQARDAYFAWLQKGEEEKRKKGKVENRRKN